MDASMKPTETPSPLVPAGPVRPASDQALEQLLACVLVPIEPSPTFVRRLHARLVTYHGTGIHSPWFILGVGAAGLLFATAWMGFALRLLFLMLSFLGVVQSSRKGALKRQRLAS
jgi:hypothetical protein